MRNSFKTKSSWLLMLLAFVLAPSACSFFKTPFDFNIGRFNETGPQQPAAITLSDPQVFARETLINDRLREQKFLNGLLNESEEIKFRDSISTPALIRDVETLQAFRAAAEVSFDPTKGAAALRQERLDDLQNQIDLTNKETELVKARKNLEKAKGEGEEKKQDVSNPANGQQTPPSKSDKPGSPSTVSTAPTQSSQTKTNTQQDQTTAPTDAILAALKARVNDLAGRLDKIAPDFSKRKVTVPIPDAERTRDAYRAELRQRLNAINLDDLHDYDGNALYRLQFRATVMPGEYKDKFGIARLTFHPPLLQDEDTDELYRTWLNHLALRLNQPLPEFRKRCPEHVASLLRLEQAGLFEIYKITPTKERPCTIYVPIPIGLLTPGETIDSSFQELSEQQKSSDMTDGKKALLDKKGLIVKNVIPILEIIRSANQENEDVRSAVQDKIDKLREVGKALPQDSSDRAILVNPPPLFKKILVEDISQRKSEEQAAVSQQKKIVEQLPDCDDRSPTFHLYEHNPKLNLVGRGEAYVYAASPLEKSQRLSTHAQTARSAELALSIAANLATKGISGTGNIGMIRQSAGIAEGFENQPIVVGFAERRALVEQEVLGGDPLCKRKYQAPQAGWVFGPEVRLDPEKSQLQLLQRFASHEVSVDLSVPGWWPYVHATLETAWIGNLHNTGRPIRLEDEANQGFHREKFVIRLPLTTADLDGFTAMIARKTVGTYLPTIAIQHVEPFYISACSKQVDLLIKGVNVWRGTRVFLGGIEAEDIAILPDMEGIAARFDLDKLFATENKALTGLGLDQSVSLAVWTRNGSDIHTLRLIGNRTQDKASCIGRTTVSRAPTLDHFEIVDISPAQICANAMVANFFVKGFFPKKEIVKVTAIFGNSVLENLTPLEGAMEKGTNIFKLTFKEGPFGAENSNIPLSMTNGKDISSAPVRLIPCGKPDVSSAQKSSVIGARTIAEIKDGKYVFTVNLKDINPSQVDEDLRIGVLPSGFISRTWIPSTTPVKALPDKKGIYDATFEIDQKASNYPQKALTEELELQFALLQKRLSGDKVLELVEGNLVYYPSKDKADVHVTPLTKLSKTGEDIIFTLPLFYGKAYPDLTKAKLKSEIDKQANIGLTVEADLSKIDKDRKLKGPIKLKDDAAEKAWNALKAGEYTVKFSFEGVEGPDIQTIQIKKQ